MSSPTALFTTRSAYPCIMFIRLSLDTCSLCLDNAVFTTFPHSAVEIWKTPWELTANLRSFQHFEALKTAAYCPAGQATTTQAVFFK